MLLPGRLARTTLGDLLGRLHRAAASGALEVDARGRRHQVHMRRGLVTAVVIDAPSPPAKLGEVLMREGMLSREALAAVLSTQEALGATAPPQGELLVSSGILSPEMRDDALRRQARSRLDWLYSLVESEARDAQLRFHVGLAAVAQTPRRRTSSSPPAPLPSLTPQEFLHGRTRVRDREATPSPTPTSSASATRESPRSPSPPSGAFAVFDRLRALRVLGLSIGADSTTVRRAFREAAARVHPDRHPAATLRERERLHEDFAELSAAYHLLSA